MIFMVWSLVGYVIGYNILPSVWHKYTTQYALKVIEYILLFLLIHLYNNKDLVEKYVNGFIIGCIVNCIWCVCQGVFYLTLHRFLNDLLFPNSGGEVWTQYGGIRAGGLNYDPANMGVLLPIVVYYGLKEKNILILLITGVSLVFSQSTTAMVGCIFVIVSALIINSKKNNKTILEKKKRKLSKLLIIILAILVLVFAFKSGAIEKILNGIRAYVEGYLNRINDNYVSASDKGPREIYYKYFIKQFYQRNILFWFCGSGIGTSMEAYAEYKIFGIVGVNVFGEIEATYLAYLFDCGIIGLAFFLIFVVRSLKAMYIKLINTGERIAIIMMGFLLSMSISNLFYHYIIAANQMLMFMFLTTYLKNDFKYRNILNTIQNKKIYKV